MYQKMTHTLEDLKKLAAMELRDVNREELVDIYAMILRISINEIYVVVGYLKEQFVTLEKEYPGVKLIENPYYDTCNNIASLYVARDYIENAIILDGDQIIYNPEILAPEFERSGYNSVWTDDETDEWLQTVENVDFLVSMNMWGLTPEFLDVLEEGFKEFFEKEVPGNPLKAEYLIPIFIGELLSEGKMSVKVLKTNDTWYGMTYHEDVAAVKDSFKKMLADGVYKADLFADL